MRRIGIFSNKNRDTNSTVTNNLIQHLNDAGVEVFLFGYEGDSLIIPNGLDNKNIDVMLTLGGDGTILCIVGYCAQNNIPILGINLGHVGFLTGIEKSDIEQIIDILSKGDYKTEERALLEIKIGDCSYLALNDVVFSRIMLNKMISIDIFINDIFMDNFYCDGYIIATPTGSTAYSLSAGGAIISPNTDAFALTPISPHSLHARPIVISGSDKVRTVVSNSTEICAVIADGASIGIINKAEDALIYKSKLTASFIKTENESFFSRLLSKLNKWSVTENSKEVKSNG